MAGETLGIDLAWTKPSAAAIKTAGYSFAVGYLSTDTSKNLTTAFVADCHAHGIAVGAVWETTSARALAGRAAGVTDAQKANTQAAALGIPTAVPVYFAVDTDTTVAKVTGYFEGVRSSSAHPVGAYGSLTVVDGLLKAGLAVVGWQTSAWSGGKVSTRACLYQRQKHTRPPIVGVGTSSYDEDVLLASSLTGAGLWLPNAPAPSPAPVQEDDMAVAVLTGDGANVGVVAGFPFIIDSPDTLNAVGAKARASDGVISISAAEMTKVLARLGVTGKAAK